VTNAIRTGIIDPDHAAAATLTARHPFHDVGERYRRTDRRCTFGNGGRDLYHSAASEELSDPEREMISPTSSTRQASSKSGR
jgi:hypothetical protein